MKGELIDINSLSSELLVDKFPLFGKTFGTVSKSSDWLIASMGSDKIYERVFKLKAKHIPMKEAVEEFGQVNETEVGKLANDFIKMTSAVYEVSPSDVKKALKFYLALKLIIERHALDYIFIRCFDIVQSLDTTGCIAFSRLNDKGIIASCEGELPSAISMTLFRKYPVGHFLR